MGEKSFGAIQLRVFVLAVLALIAGIPAVAQSAPVFTGVSLSVNSPTVPPGGTLQMQVFVTEPNPILKGKQGIKGGGRAAAFQGVSPQVAVLGAIRDAALFSPGGDVSGVAVGKTGGTQLYFSSPLTSFGTVIDTPVMTITMPVTAGAQSGQTSDLTLDPANSLWYDPNSKLYPVELKSGVLTVGGTMSVSEVTPGAGTVLAGKVISIKGTGFDPSATVDINEGKIATSQYISPTLIQVTLSKALDIRGKRVRVKNSNNETVTFYPYQRTTASGNSTHALIASCIPLFAQTTWKLGYFRPTLQGKIFTGLALQNLNTKKANVVLNLYSKVGGTLLATHTVVLGTNSAIARDLAEFFPGVVPATGTSLAVSSDQPIQMLGMLADDSTKIVLSLTPTATP